FCRKQHPHCGDFQCHLQHNRAMLRFIAYAISNYMRSNAISGAISVHEGVCRGSPKCSLGDWLEGGCGVGKSAAKCQLSESVVRLDRLRWMYYRCASRCGFTSRTCTPTIKD